jgi:hypothetical protein
VQVSITAVPRFDLDCAPDLEFLDKTARHCLVSRVHYIQLFIYGSAVPTHRLRERIERRRVNAECVLSSVRLRLGYADAPSGFFH